MQHLVIRLHRRKPPLLPLFLDLIIFQSKCKPASLTAQTQSSNKQDICIIMCPLYEAFYSRTVSMVTRKWEKRQCAEIQVLETDKLLGRGVRGLVSAREGWVWQRDGDRDKKTRTDVYIYLKKEHQKWKKGHGGAQHCLSSVKLGDDLHWSISNDHLHQLNKAWLMQDVSDALLINSKAARDVGAVSLRGLKRT